jgi:hypothetical protein
MGFQLLAHRTARKRLWDSAPLNSLPQQPLAQPRALDADIRNGVDLEEGATRQRPDREDLLAVTVSSLAMTSQVSNTSRPRRSGSGRASPPSTSERTTLFDVVKMSLAMPVQS